MPIDTETPDSPGWWLQTLARELHDRRNGRVGKRRFDRSGVQPSRIRPPLLLLQDYLDGDPPLREDIHSGWARPFRQYLRMGRMNIAPKLVSSTGNKMSIRDFRTSAAGDELGDVEARRIMRRNAMKLIIRQVHDHMLGLGDGYTMVTPPDATRDWSRITVESPMQCITYEDPASGETTAALKMYRDYQAGADFAYLFLLEDTGPVLYVARCADKTSSIFRRDRREFSISDRWEWDVDRFDDIPGTRIPVTRFSNKHGKSEIEGQLDHLDRINDKLFNEWWIGKVQAFRQRALEMGDEEEGLDGAYDGDDDEVDPDPLTPEHEDWNEMFTSAPDAMWKLPKGAKIWESKESDVRQLVNSIQSELQWLAFTSGKPLHTITPDAANGSAEGASLQREEHVDEIGDRQDRAEGGWARTMSLAFEYQDMGERADVAGIEVIWGPAERFSLSEKASAASQVVGIVPNEAILTDILQYAPADVVERLRGQRAADLLYPATSRPAGATAGGDAAAAAAGA